MNVTLWIMTSVLAVAYTVGAASQLIMSKERYRSLADSQHWVDDFGAGHIKAIGAVKLTGAIGLILPAVVDVAPVLVPLAACGLALFMAGAATTRFRRSEWMLMVGDTAFLAAFAFIAWGRFALSPFV
ncbi:DoxX family protein [Gordonia liuliyuniae]|uniref:DoxX family protein n=1 Tax=Gordonia liuliyuniae TaxID=2911517 RepID=A0ABS9IQK5_9ACTN|nr:DoxX family protein [Gordonia liuliyuniae]MCF8587831.1 DoxX family protein [Gordonia liuliyuniae]